MAIPDGKLYDDGQLSPGSIATTEPVTINTENAGALINYGIAVVLQDGKVVPATGGPIYGVALKRSYVNADHFTEDDSKQGHWENGETLGVLRDGTIAVPITTDVIRGESAAVDASGGFKTASVNDRVVGIFLSDGEKGGTASLQTRVQWPEKQAENTTATSVSGNTEQQ